MKTMYSLMTMLAVVAISAGVAGVACSAENNDRMTPAASAKESERIGVEKDSKKTKAANTSKDGKTVKGKTEKASDKGAVKAAVQPAKKEKDGKRQATDGKRAQVGTKTEGRGKKA